MSSLATDLFVLLLVELQLHIQVHVLTDGDIVGGRFNSTLQMVHAAGETNRIQQGLFENYLEYKGKDPGLALVSHL